MHCDVLNARDYGVPQNRKRVFIAGVRNDILKKK
ncbi:DNA cytosine methyltransferase [Escherichia coli]|nr:DNA cytosine methyltransferase [Escherichia coli]MCW0136609.1 DNA cytosine methyltransferase [Escherichia coli]WJW06654.1 DNA cytosine methyltransferase [Escherichia coli]